ncbi:MAG: hypothetical protein JNN29_09720 [Chitinophagaceae bacterium]|nr:hypothetical protein [Chitinophagaceae bacterium]MBN8666677.1 hypothetical protein [Chitinophagales bacterium]
MKKLLIYMLVAGSIVSLASCKKNNMVVDKDPLTPSFAKFNVSATTGTYYIKSTNDPYKIPIGFTSVSDKDRVVNIAITTTTGAAAGVQYNAPATFTMPAGKAVDTLLINGLFSGYPSSNRVDVITITLNDGDVNIAAYNKTFTLTMRKYCDVILANLAGNYTQTYENGTYGPYTSALSNFVSTGATTATATLSNIYDSGISATIGLDWTDPTNFKVTMAGQQTPYTSGGLPLFVRANSTGTKTFSSCDNTFTLALQLYTTAGVYDSWVMTMAR